MQYHWPVPDSYEKNLPLTGLPAFGNQRKQGGKHTGVDIYAPNGSKVIAIESGTVIVLGQFTGAPDSPQWRKTYFVMVKHESGKVALYGEVRKPRLQVGQKICSGRIIGYLAKVKRGASRPGTSMLHFELYTAGQRKPCERWCKQKPQRLLNPSRYLKKTL